MFSFDTQVLVEHQADSSLTLYARGLGIDRLFLNHLKVYCDSALLVLVLNTTSYDEAYFSRWLKTGRGELETSAVRIITSDVNPDDRYNTYLKGGIQFVTSRILVVDLLTGRLPSALVNGVMIYNAHTCVQHHDLAFILKLFREKNKKAFIKSFSDNPRPFGGSFLQLQRSLRTLFAEKILAFPRFNSQVAEELESCKNNVIEVSVTLPSQIKEMQTLLLDITADCVREINHCCPEVEKVNAVTLEDALDKGYLQEDLEALVSGRRWLLEKVRRLTQDLSIIRKLLKRLEQLDSNASSFFTYLESLRKESLNSRAGGWLFSDSATRLFNLSRKLEADTSTPTNVKEIPSSTENKNWCSPKFSALVSCLNEIVSVWNSVEEPDQICLSGCILLVAANEESCMQLHKALEKLVDADHTRNRSSCEDQAQSLCSLRGKLELLFGADESEAFVRQRQKEATSTNASSIDENTKDENQHLFQSCFCGLHLVIQSHSNSYALLETLKLRCPNFIILYSADLRFIRQVEVYKAQNSDSLLRVYFLMYETSTEEQRYLLSIKKENESFEFLLKEKGNLLLQTDYSPFTCLPPIQMSTRDAAGVSEVVERRIIVDMRELRSELPSVLYQRGISVIPLTIEVGDYVLAPDICVERKSQSDLIGSLNSGRLYTQTAALCASYRVPILLIELDGSGNQSFGVDPNSPSFGGLFKSTTSKLSLLTLHFPKLRILWSTSPQATVDMFEDLKLNCPEPVPEHVTGGTTEGPSVSSQLDLRTEEMLVHLPGVSFKNIRSLLNRCNNLKELACLSQSEHCDALSSNAAGTALFKFIHTNIGNLFTNSNDANHVFGKARVKRGRFRT